MPSPVLIVCALALVVLVAVEWRRRRAKPLAVSQHVSDILSRNGRPIGRWQ